MLTSIVLSGLVLSRLVLSPLLRGLFSEDLNLCYPAGLPRRGGAAGYRHRGRPNPQLQLCYRQISSYGDRVMAPVTTLSNGYAQRPVTAVVLWQSPGSHIA